MAYNLPPPWDPGFALPSNVRDEGLERRGFVTRMLPRGTYDNPSVGTGGYAVPKYVTDEGYGQGTHVTKWIPRGTQPNIPHNLDKRPQVLAQRRLPGGGVEVTMAALSGTAMPAPYTQFGQRAAVAVLRRIAALPASERRAMLKRTLDRIDPALWKRTAQLAEKYKSAGLTAAAAVERALAEAMSTGIAAEVVQAGLSRSAPQPNSLLGLGCYGAPREALGATQQFLTATSVMTLLQTPQCPAGQTWSPGETKAGYSWDATSSSWKRTRAGQADVAKPGFCVAAAPSVDVAQGVPDGPEWLWDAKTNQWVKNRLYVPKAPENTGPRIQLGPWIFDGSLDRVEIRDQRSAIPKIWTDWMATQIGVATSKQTELLRKLPQGAALIQQIDGAIVGQPGVKLMAIKGQVTGQIPLARFEHPIKKKEYGLYITDVDKFGAGTYRLVFKEIEKGILDAIFGWVARLVAKIIDVVKDAVAAVADLACQVVTSPTGQQAGAAIGVAVGAGASAGAAGAAVAGSLCQKPPEQPPPPPPPPPPSGGAMLPVAIAAGGLLIAAVILTKKKAP